MSTNKRHNYEKYVRIRDFVWSVYFCVNINPLKAGVQSMSNILKQTFSWKVQFSLSMYDLLADTRR